MVNGPLTPPPTTATELQDEARENPSTVEAPQEAPTSLPQSRPEHYQLILASIAEAISNRNYSQVTNIAQEADYEVLSSCLSFYSFIHLRFRR